MITADHTQQQYSSKSDVYMFGVTLFELFTYGAQPWAGMFGGEIVLRVHRVSLLRTRCAC